MCFLSLVYSELCRPLRLHVTLKYTQVSLWAKKTFESNYLTLSVIYAICLIETLQVIFKIRKYEY
jgi:hypothetical protein